MPALDFEKSSMVKDTTLKIDDKASQPAAPKPTLSK